MFLTFRSSYVRKRGSRFSFLTPRNKMRPHRFSYRSEHNFAASKIFDLQKLFLLDDSSVPSTVSSKQKITIYLKRNIVLSKIKQNKN